MANTVDYLAPECASTPIRPTDVQSGCSPASGQELREWPEDEIARIRLVLRKLTALRVRNAEDAEDLVQETFLTMTQKCPGIELQKGLLVWGMGILRKKLGNFYRRAQRFTSLEKEMLRAALRAPRHSNASPESEMLRAELQELVQRTIKSLPEGERMVLELVLAGLSTGEISGVLCGEAYQNVVNRIHRGRKKVIEELARSGFDVRRYRKRNRHVSVELKKGPGPRRP